MIREPVRYEGLVEFVTQWSPTLRLILIQDLLRSLEPEVADSKQTRSDRPAQTLDRALGLLATSESAPTDDEIEQILVDARMEKHG